MGRGISGGARLAAVQATSWRTYEALSQLLAIEGVSQGRALIWDHRAGRYYSASVRDCTCRAQTVVGPCPHQRFVPLYLQFETRNPTLRAQLGRGWSGPPVDRLFDLKPHLADDRPNVPVLRGEAGFARQLGLNPVTLDPESLPEECWREVYEQLDVVVLWGGTDVPPQWSGGADHAEPSARDRFERLAARWAWEEGRPFLGICRGLQMLNVALGGTLYQDIPTDFPRSRYPRRRAHEGIDHEIVTAPGSRLETLIGTHLVVNSYHHQAIRDLAPGLRVAARSTDGLWPEQALREGVGDGLIEAVEAPDRPGVLGVQFHPELMPLERVRSLFAAALDPTSQTRRALAA